jgi:hypothetical protein
LGGEGVLSHGAEDQEGRRSRNRDGHNN